MSDIKYCPSCGSELSVSAAFCHKCGQKQNIDAEIKSEPIKTEEISVENELSSKSDTEISIENQVEANDTSNTDGTQSVNDTASQDLHKVSGVNNIQSPPENTVVEDAVSEPQSISVEIPAADQQVEPAPQTPSVQPSIANETLQNQEIDTQTKPKKKFPWGFTVIWGILFIAVAAWGFYLYYLYVGEYDYPKFTEDVQRILLFSGAIFVLIYTISLKLSMKKFKVVPTIILVIACLVIFYFYCMVELQDGDLLHDFVSDITERVLPVFGLD